MINDAGKISCRKAYLKNVRRRVQIVHEGCIFEI